MNRIRNGLLALALSLTFAAQAAVPGPTPAPAAAPAAIDLTALDKDMVGPRTEVLVLGTLHLSELKDFDPRSLDPVLDKLAAFKPGFITVEDIDAEQCDLAHRHPAVYGADYCASTAQAKAATGLDAPAAIAAIDKALADWPARPTASDRRRLATWFMASGERASAYVQWLRLPPSERRSGDGLDAALVEMLKKAETRNNESYQIAARLAARLGHERVYPIDDHTGDNHRLADRKAFGQALEQAWKAGGARLDGLVEQQRRLAQADDLLPLYRAINDPGTLAVFAEANVSAALRAPSPRHYPQIWVNGWEIRNLRMVANILQVVRDRPDSRVLAIVGSSHKPWFDGWLGQMSGVDVVDTLQVLK